ncbi:unnamed protein product [Schistosoma curassoni]|uniref:Reverse transcriptase n=1 Tax=Schistosoma curassoni TaxID=6186 RepID=A0A183KVW2_9TREM|nr:unnamed protein product [Schistosoma curassoni]
MASWANVMERYPKSSGNSSNICWYGNHKVREKNWISAASTALIDARKLIPSGSEHNEERTQLKRKLTRSLHNDREQWWVAKAREMEKAAAIGNSRQLFRLVKETDC